MKPRHKLHGNIFERMSQRMTHFTGSTTAFMIALVIILLWLVSGPLFSFSDTWQLVINTGTTIITFLMVFLIQRTQNKDSLAIQIKLNELVAAVAGASNRLVDVEDLSEEDLEVLHEHFRTLAAMAKADKDIKESHSVEEAERRYKAAI